MDAATIEQMNKLRKSLGLPLLNASSNSSSATYDSKGQATGSAQGPSFKAKSKTQDGSESDDEEEGEPASTLETREAAAFANFQQIQDEERKRIEREKRKIAIQKARDQQARHIRLEGRGLGDVGEEGEQDAKSWLRGQKKRQRAIEEERARRVEEEQAEREREAELQYTTKDLAGIQVAHELGDFDDAVGEQILTLKDQEIGKGDDDEDGEGDILENAEILAKDRLNDKLKLKKKVAYDVHAEQEGLLSQYDDKKRKAFALDEAGGGSGPLEEEREAKRMAIGDRLKDIVSLDILKAEPVSDYQEIKIKKPKKTKKHKRVRGTDADEDEDIFVDAVIEQNGHDQMDVDAPETKTKPQLSDPAFNNDDEDLANALSFTRRANLKKSKRQRALDVIQQIKAEEGEEEESQIPDPEQGGLVLDDTTTFLDQLASRPADEQPETVVKTIERETSPKLKAEPESPDHNMPDADEQVVTAEAAEELLDRLRREQSTHTPEVLSKTGLEEEQKLDQGLGSALSLLRQRGLVKDPTNLSDRNTLYRDRQRFMVEQRLREHDAEQRARAQRERDRQSGRLSHMSTREREELARVENTRREHQSSIAAAAAFNRAYRPDINLKYIDEGGRELNQKEAFKHLSHQFHGKGSGKGKTEKQLKKMAEERKRESRSVLDSSREAERGYEGAAQHQRRGGEAGVRLQ